MRIRISMLLAVGWSTAAWAGEAPLYQPVPDWVVSAPAVAHDAGEAGETPFVVLDQQQRVDGDRLWSYTDSASRVTSAEMLGQLGTVAASWHPAKGDLIVHRAEIVRGEAVIDLLASGTKFTVLRREQELEQRSLTGILTATLAVEGLRLNDLLRISYSITREDPALGGNIQTATSLLTHPVVAKFAHYRLLWPSSASLKWRTYGKMPELKPVTKRNLTELSIALPLAEQPEMPSDAPSRFHVTPMIEASTFDSWEDVSRTGAALYRTDGLIDPAGELAKEVTRIKAAESDPLRRAAMALRLVQDQTRYLFEGMEQGDYVPQPPERTWEVRFGDCKAKTLLLLAMLHAMEIPAEPVMANTSMGDWTPERLPSFAAFDHVLVRAEVGQKTLWLDGTSSGNRVHDLEDTPAFGHVLPLRDEGVGLDAIRTRPSARPMIAAKIELDQSAGLDFPAPYQLSVTVRGQMADMVRVVNAQASPDKVKDMIVGLAGEFTNNGSVVTRSISFDENEGTATIAASGLANYHWRQEDDREQLVVDGIFTELGFETDRARAAWQKIPVVTQYPLHMLREVRIRLPSEGKGFELVGDSSLSETVAGLDLARTSRLTDGWLTLEERLAARDTQVPPERIAETRQRFALASSRMLRLLAPRDYPPRWRQVRDAKKSGALEPILALLQQEIDSDPEEAHHYVNRARFHVGVYDRRAAIKDLDRVIELEPDIDTYLWRANLLFELGEYDRALADVELARSMDPGSTRALELHARVHSEGGKDDLALALVEERIEVAGKDKPDFLALKAEFLGRAGRIEDALAAADAAVAASPGNATLLNNRCWLKAIHEVELDAALKDCTSAIELAQTPAAALDSRAMVYFRMGRLDEALADLDAANELSPMSAVLFLRGIVKRRIGDEEGSNADLAAARLMYPRVDAEYARFGVTP